MAPVTVAWPGQKGGGGFYNKKSNLLILLFKNNELSISSNV